MTLRNSMFAAGAIALAAALASAASAQGYNPEASARAAQDWQQDASALAPSQAQPADALNPNASVTIASQPVPDTPANRSQFGQPLSRAGRRTAPIGD